MPSFLPARSRAVAGTAVVALLLAAGAARAQVVGMITGTVMDQSGMPLKGVRIAARSATQIGGEKIAYTNAEGFFRVPGLQPGIFEIAATSPGLKSVIQKQIHVGVNAAAEVIVMMEVRSAEEEVKIVEKAPVVSTTSAKVKEAFDSDFIDNLPLDKRTGYGGFIRDNVPGAAEGGPNPAIGDWTVRVRGGNNQQNAFMVEGFVMNGQKITLNSLAAMEILTAGAGAENAGAPGAVVNMVTQSGSNRYQLDVTAWHEDSRLRLFLTPTDPGQNVRTTFLNPAVSGPIVKDKLWFYFNTEVRSNVTARDADLAGQFAQPAPRYYGNARGTLKLTWQATPRNKVQSFTLLNREFWDNYREGAEVHRDAQMRRDWSDYFTGVTWEALLTDNLFFKSQVGLQRFFRVEKPQQCERDPGTCMDILPFEQLQPRRNYQGNYDKLNQLIDKSFELTNTLEWFKNTASLGEHSVKVVSRFINRSYETADGAVGEYKLIYNGLQPDRRIDYYSNDPRIEAARQGYWVRTSAGYRFSNSISDAIRVTRFLTVTPGIALTTNHASTSLMGTVVDQSVVTPHLAVAWDATHDGRTVLRASYNHYVDTDAVRVARHALGEGVSRECQYNSATGLYDLNCRYAGGARGRSVGLPCGPQGFHPNGQPCREALKTPRTIEYTLGAERELVSGVGLGADFIHRAFSNPYERRETNRIWNAAGSGLAAGGGYRSGRAELIDDLGTPDGARRLYTAITVSLKKREGALKMTGSYTWSHLRGNVPGEEDNEFGDNAGRDVYLWGDLPYDRRHEIRTSATYQWTSWLSSGITYSYTSGMPYSRRFYNAETGRFDDYRAPVGVDPGVDVNDPRDDRTLRLPDLQRLNLQLRANLLPLLGWNLEAFTDVVNVLALRTTTSVVTEDGASFGAPLTRLDPFRLRFGMRFRY